MSPSPSSVISARPDRMTETLLRPLLQTSWRFYALVLILGSVVVAGFVAWGSQMWFGFGISGIRWPA